MPPTSKPRTHRNVALYPESHDINSLSREALALKIARHSHCSDCEGCHGLGPDRHVNVVLDSEWNANASGHVGYIATCRCGHDVGDHGALEDIPTEEFNRRGRVAIRLDELLEVSISIKVFMRLIHPLLQDQKKLLDFDYDDSDIRSLRKQMRIPEEALSPLSEDVLSLGKQWKLGVSSLSVNNSRSICITQTHSIQLLFHVTTTTPQEASTIRRSSPGFN